jgi:aspartyl-tRNA(Asn)/glutamyl-tRNA(Gln) amidotransferase subunit A
MFDGIKGKSAMDATSYPAEYDKELLNPSWDRIKNLTIGLPSEYFIDGIDPEVRESVEKAIARLKEAGIRFKEVSLPHTKYALSCYYIIMPAEVSSNLARFDGIRYSRNEHVGKEPSLLDIYLKQRGHGFGAEVKRRIILGTFVLSSGYYDAYYAKAQKVRSLIKHDFEIAFKDVDVMLTPVTPSPAFKIGEKVDDPLSMYLSDIFTLTANLAGIPGLAVPVENDWKGKLPVGFQLLGKPYREADILGIGRLYEKL